MFLDKDKRWPHIIWQLSPHQPTGQPGRGVSGMLGAVGPATLQPPPYPYAVHYEHLCSLLSCAVLQQPPKCG